MWHIQLDAAYLRLPFAVASDAQAAGVVSPAFSTSAV